MHFINARRVSRSLNPPYLPCAMIAHGGATMRYRTASVAVLLLMTLAPAGQLGAEENVLPAQSAAPLLSTGTTVLGETLHYPTNVRRM
jgi:hypothetical protein